MIDVPIHTRPDLVEVSNGAYASMIGPDGSFPGAELIGLADGVRTSPAREVGCDPIGLALRHAWALWKRLNKPTARSRRDKTQACTWRALEIGAGRGALAHYTTRLGQKMQPGGPISISLVEPVLEHNRALADNLTTLQAKGLISEGNLKHQTFAEFLEGRERNRIAWLDMPLYDLILLVYSYAGLLVETNGNDATASASLLRSLIQLLDEHGLLIIADRTISPDSPNTITVTAQDIPKLLRLAAAIWRAVRFFHVSPGQVRGLLHDLVRIQQEPGWDQLAAVHHEAACRGQQLAAIIKTLKQMPSVTYQVLDFGGNWVLIVWKR